MVALTAAACASRAPIAERPVGGEVDYRLLPPQNEGSTELRPGQSATGGNVMDASVVLPVYPPGWLGQRLSEVRAEALVVIDGDGRAQRIEVDRVALSAQCGRCVDDFAASVESALRQWQFAPLEIIDWIDGADLDGDGEADSVTRGAVGTRPYSLRLAFRFGWREGRAVVDHSP